MESAKSQIEKNSKRASNSKPPNKTQVMLTTTKELYKVNKKLSKSIRQNPWLYFFVIGIFCVAVISMISVTLFKDYTDRDSFIVVAYFVAVFDIIAIIARITNRAFIEPYQLAIFPISKWKKTLFHFAILLLDYKSLIYLSSMVCFVVLFVQQSLYTGAFLSVIVWFLLLSIILAWTALFYSLFGKYLDKMGNNIQYIAVFFIVVLTGMEEFIDDFMVKIPVLKQAGATLYGLWTESPQLVWENFPILLGSLGLPLILLLVISRLG
ncbi:hypothetical protein [Fodinibius halophilus]|uniref:Uncharacterized protein n=1 Tax=Fodinibius halophilus TaxID=1736908 RepID=A0A6M1T2C6_9BACT|nr:hypothetical protein [Fodinibius halophilus]NGP89626.1 hypothetical protein [Fodinibius halophilus]